MKFGVDVRIAYLDDVINYGAAAGTFSYGSNFVQSSSSGTAPTFGGPEASFLLGLPTSGSYFNPATANFHANYMAFFVQNDWRVTDPITVNLGLRYDHQSPSRTSSAASSMASTQPQSKSASPALGGVFSESDQPDSATRSTRWVA